MADFFLHEVAGYSSDGVQVQAGVSSTGSLLNKEYEFDSEMAYRLLNVQTTGEDEDGTSTVNSQDIEEVVALMRTSAPSLMRLQSKTNKLTEVHKPAFRGPQTGDM